MLLFVHIEKEMSHNNDKVLLKKFVKGLQIGNNFL